MDIEMMFIVIFSMAVMAAGLWIAVWVINDKQRREDDAQPVQTMQAKIVAMEQASTWVMFELENGDRVRLRVKTPNSLVLGDRGKMTWQGKRLISFERNK